MSSRANRIEAANYLTQGPILKSVVLFALPLLGTSVVQQLYNTVDLLFAGNVLGTNASAALGISSLLITCLLGLFVGISVGVNVVVARLFGASDTDGVGKALHTAVTFGLIGGLTMAFFGFLFAPIYIALMATPQEITDDALAYLQVYFISLPIVVLYNVFAGASRALGDSATPLKAQLIGGLVNVAANALFLLTFGLGIKGLAVATLFSQGIAAGIVFMRLSRAEAPWALRIGDLRIHAPFLKEILLIGVPAGLQSMLITFSNVLLQYQIDTLGTASIAAFTSYFKVELPIYYAIVSIGQAATTFVAQNHGAGNEERARKGIRICLTLCVCVTILLSAVLVVSGHWAFWIFNQDLQVIELGVSIITVSFPFYWLYALMEIFSAGLRGRGKAIAPMIVILVNVCILRVSALFVLMSIDPAATSVALAYPISWATCALCMFACYMRLIRTSSGKRSRANRA